MKTLLITLGIGLIVGLGVSTAASVYLPGRATLAERYEAEVSSEGGGEEVANTLAGGEGSEALAGEALEVAAALLPGGVAGDGESDDTGPGVAADEAAGLADLSSGYVSAPGVGHGAAVQGAPAPAGIDADRLAKLFGSMPARDAARVLDHLDDAEVRVILGKLGNREAAALLGTLEPERAALISRMVIRGEGGTP